MGLEDHILVTLVFGGLGIFGIIAALSIINDSAIYNSGAKILMLCLAFVLGVVIAMGSIGAIYIQWKMFQNWSVFLLTPITWLVLVLIFNKLYNKYVVELSK